MPNMLRSAVCRFLSSLPLTLLSALSLSAASPMQSESTPASGDPPAPTLPLTINRSADGRATPGLPRDRSIV